MSPFLACSLRLQVHKQLPRGPAAELQTVVFLESFPCAPHLGSSCIPAVAEVQSAKGDGWSDGRDSTPRAAVLSLGRQGRQRCFVLYHWRKMLMHILVHLP